MAVHGKLLLSDHCYLEIPGNIIDVYKYHFTEFLSESLKDFSLHFFPKCVARKLDHLKKGSSSKEEPNVSTKLDEGCSYKCFMFRSLDKLIDSFIDSIKSEKKKEDFKFVHKRNNKYYYTNSAGQFLCLLFGSRIKKNVTF